MFEMFEAQLLTPEGALFEGEVFTVTVPGTLGNFQILFNHAPIVSTLSIGKITIVTSSNDELIFAVSGGFLEMNDNKLTI